MKNYSNIKDVETRRALEDIESRIRRIEKIPQIPSDTPLEKLIEIVNKITDNMKRRR